MSAGSSDITYIICVFIMMKVCMLSIRINYAIM